MKYLRTFETRADYKSAKKAHTLEVPNVSLVKQDYAVYIMPTFTSKESAEAGDIIVYSKAAYTAWTEAEAGSPKDAAYETLLGSVRYMKPEHFNADSAELYVPEAIVAVPYSHTGDGTVRAMSLRHMSADDPRNGSTSNTTIVWGAYDDISGITNHTGGAVVSNVALGDKSTLTSASETYLPSDTFTALEVINTDSEFYWGSKNGNHAPCPYKADGSLNRQYLGEWGTNGSKLTDNCLGDMNGASNTKKIIDTLNKAFLDQTLFAATITNAQNDGNTNIFPAAMCCQRYKTVLKPNTVSYDSAYEEYTYGDWYLPSAGEVGYTIVSKGRISYALSRINAALPGTAAAWVNDWLWSSSECNSNRAWGFYPSNGDVYFSDKSNGYRVRAFAAF